MRKKIFKWLGISAAVFVGLIAVALTTVYAVSSSRMSTDYYVNVKPVEIPTDSASIDHGRHIAVTRSCSDCHGKGLAGGTVVDGPFFVGYLHGPNLTRGKGGVGSQMKDIDWVRAIRHGVGPNHNALVVMPSNEYYYLSDEDLGCLIAYLKALPPVDKQMPDMTLGPLLRTLYLAGQVSLAAEEIDHAAPRPTAPPVAVTAEYGNYIAHSCVGCHGDGLSGGPIPGAPPDWKPSSNITPGGNIGKWSADEFISTLRTGKTPDGRTLDASMPWVNFGKMTDTELKALYTYLRSVPAKPSGNR